MAAHYRSTFELATYAELAMACGLGAGNVEAIRKGERPTFPARDESPAYDVAHQLVTTHRIGDELYSQANDCFDESGLIELVTVVGYYCMVTLMLNAFLEPVPQGQRDPFEDA